MATNLESSHTYPNVKAFYAEVARVLKPGGYFLYADVLSAEQFETGVATLEACGLAVERSRNITLNVLLSCDEIARNRASAYASTNDPEVMREFLAIPGSGMVRTHADSRVDLSNPDAAQGPSRRRSGGQDTVVRAAARRSLP